MRFVAVCAVALTVCGCQAETVEKTNGPYEVGKRCSESQLTFGECDAVCSKMGGAKAACWEGFFDGLHAAVDANAKKIRECAS